MAQTYYSKNKADINNGEFKVYIIWSDRSTGIESDFPTINEYADLNEFIGAEDGVEYGKMQNDGGFMTAVGQTVDDNYGSTITLDRKFSVELSHIAINKTIKKDLISKDGMSCYVLLVNGGDNGGTAILCPNLVYNNDFESNSASMKKALFNLSKDIPNGEMIGIVKKFTA